MTTLDDRVITISRDGTTQPNEVEVIEGEGMPSFHDVPQGDMFIEYSVVMPAAVSDDARRKLVDAFGPHVSLRDEL